MTSFNDRRIAFIGAGNMAGALLRGLLAEHATTAANIVCVDVRKDRLAQLHEEFGIAVERDIAKAVATADVVVLAVKPQVFDRVLPEVASAWADSKLLISVAAGVSTKAIGAFFPAGVRVLRAMPNTPVLALAGATGLAGGGISTEEDLEFTQKLFECVGIVQVMDESLIDAVTGLSGSGPAYIFLIIEALADAGVKVGLHRQSAMRLAAQTVLGSAKLLLETGEHPGMLKDMVTSPGGTAIAGLHTLEQGGLRTTLINAVETATGRAKELGRELDERLSSNAKSMRPPSK